MSVRIYPTLADAVAHAPRTTVAPLAWNPVDHLLSRCAFGPTAPTRRWVAKHGPDAWYDQQVGYLRRYPGYGALPAVAELGPLLNRSEEQVRRTLRAEGKEYHWDAMDQLSNVTLGLQAWSPAQLYEVLVDLFSNHLNVANHMSELWNLRHVHDRAVVREHIGGTFTDMLLASARNPAMLTYLSLRFSNRVAVNENYGRELLEMHTVGMNYSQDDVDGVARLLTGRNLDYWGNYIYEPDDHPLGAVQVLDFYHPNTSGWDGESGGDALIRYLAEHPYTAQNLARKVCVRLVSDDPSDDLVAAVAAAYLDNSTAILPMVRTVLCSSEFWAARGCKVRRPTENVLATLRVLGVPVKTYAEATATLNWVTKDMGNLPLEWTPPNGYPDVAESWRSSGSLLAQWHAHIALMGGWWSGFTPVSVSRLYQGGPPRTSGEAINQLTHRITGQQWPASRRAILQNMLQEPASTPMARSRMKFRGIAVAAAILDSPHHALR